MRVFISYSSIDVDKARTLCDYIENNGIYCWIAPRDIPLGSAYGEAIDCAVRECTDAIFLLSESSIKSIQVEQELYLANQEQKNGLRIFPIYIENVELRGSFRYILSSKQSFHWNDSLSLKSLIEALRTKPNSVDLFAVHNDDNTRNLIRDCIKRYYAVYSAKYCDANMCEEIIPSVSAVGDWLESDISTVSLLSSAELLWNKKNRNTLYVGKSGFGKTTGLFMLLKKLMDQEESLVIFYIQLSECSLFKGQDKIIKYIYRNYIEQFDAGLSFFDFHNYIYSDNDRKEIPRVIIMIDGLDECEAECCDDIQFELNGLISNVNVQLLLTSRTTNHMFYLGNVAVQCFDVNRLTKNQIDSYLKTSNIVFNEKSIPYNIISNPLILTLYARTNIFLNRYHGSVRCYTKNICTEADVLWNFIESTAVKFAEKKAKEEEQQKFVFAFRFILPRLAFQMEEKGRIKFSMREFCDCALKAMEMLKDEDFVDVFDEYFGYEENINFTIKEYRILLDIDFCQQIGLISKSELNEYSFTSSVFQKFFAAVFLYWHLLLTEKTRDRPTYFEKFFLSFETCRYLGELCGEFENTPYWVNGKWVCPDQSTMITRGLNLYRSQFGKKEQTAVSNFLQIIKISRKNDISGLDLSYLDLRRTTFSHIICSRKNDESITAVSFEGSLLDEWNFRTLGYCGDVSPIRFLKDYDCIAVADRNQIFIIDFKSQHIIKTFEIDSDFVQSIAVSSDGRSLACTGIWGEIKEWDLSTGKIITDYHIRDKMLQYVEYYEDNSIIFVTRDKEICIYNRKEEIHRVLFYFNVNNFVCENDNTMLITSRVREVIRYDTRSKSVLEKYSSASTGGGYITKALCTKDKKSIIGCTKGGYVLEWEKGQLEPVKIYKVDGDMNSFILSPDEKWIYCVSEQRGLIIIYRSTGNISLAGAPCKGRWIDIDADFKNDMLAISGLEGQVVVYSVQTFESHQIKEKSHEYSLPFLCVEGCSLKNLNANSEINTTILCDLIQGGAIVD